MVVCKFYNQGNCRFGDNCKFEHPGSQRDGGRGGFGGGSNGNNRFGAFGGGDRYRPGQQQQPPQSGAFGGNRDAKSLPYHLDKADIEADLTGQRPIYPLSCYSPGRDTPRQLIEGPVEISPEELRCRFYMQRAAGNEQLGQQEESELHAKMQQQVKAITDDIDGAIRYIEEGANVHPNRLDIVRGDAPPSGSGANSNQFQQSSANPFSNAPAQSSTFGQPSAPAFGQSAFGQASNPGQTNSAFGQPSNPGQTNSAFGAPSSIGQTPSAFGQPSGAGGGSAFGKPAFGASGFGQPSMPGAGSAFGQASSMGAKPAFGQASAPGTASAFGQASAPGAASAFGQASTPGQPSPFGQASASGQTSSAFGKPAFGQSTFGQAAQPGANASPFGQQPQSGASPFGQQAQQGSASPFGQQAQQSQQPNPFGQAQNPQAAAQPNPFGSAAASQPSAFGQPSAPGFGTPSLGTQNQDSAAQSANPFAQNAQSAPSAAAPSPFGAQAQNASPFAQAPAQTQAQPSQPQPAGMTSDGKPIDPKDRYKEGNPEEYEGDAGRILEEIYRRVGQMGRFNDDEPIPLTPPKCEWIAQIPL